VLFLLGCCVDFWGVIVRLPFCHVYQIVVRFDYRSDECQIFVVHWGGVPSECRVCYQSQKVSVV
jgi:hypothetical protein